MIHRLGSEKDPRHLFRSSDALAIINSMRSAVSDLHETFVPLGVIAPKSGLQLDSNNDGSVTALDALHVINVLARSQVSRLAGEFISDERFRLVDEVLHEVLDANSLSVD